MKTQTTSFHSTENNKMVTNRIYLSPPHMGSGEMRYIQEAFESNWIAPMGANVDGFETDLEKFLSVKSCAALSSGTAALHLSLIMLGVRKDDYVICPSFTFSASANPILYENATPVFVDAEPETWNMDPAQLEEAIQFCLRKNKKPKAIIVVHLYGMPANMQAILKIADEQGIPVIEDAAESLGSTYNGIQTGTFGLMGVLSFNGNKIITTSGGGALVSSDPELIRKAKFLSTQARDPAPHYQHSVLGYNYRLSNICAGIGRGQMEVLTSRIEARRSNFNRYKLNLSAETGINFQPEPSGSVSNRWLTAITFDANKTNKSTERVRLALEKFNIESRPIWKPLHLQPVFKQYPAFLTGHSEQIFSTGLCLPSGSALTAAQIDQISSIVSSI
jgi:dTDP-4-amino-4,6-dideoxygalactose transaminase